MIAPQVVQAPRAMHEGSLIAGAWDKLKHELNVSHSNSFREICNHNTSPHFNCCFSRTPLKLQPQNMLVQAGWENSSSHQLNAGKRVKVTGRFQTQNNDLLLIGW